MSRILITGGCGFIGSHLTEQLLEEGFCVRVFDMRPYPYQSSSDSFESIVGNINNFSEIQEASKDCDGIIHLASVSRVSDGYKQPWQCIMTNVCGTANVLEVTRLSLKSPWIIFASSREAHAKLSQEHKFLSLYGITKYSAELYCYKYVKDYGLRILNIRFSDVYGSWRDNHNKVLMVFLHNALLGKPIVIKDTSERFDFVFYEDLISGIKKGIKYISSQKEGVYDSARIETGHVVTLQELATIIIREIGSVSIIKPKPTIEIFSATTKDDSKHNISDILCFNPKVSLVEGLRCMISTKL